MNENNLSSPAELADRHLQLIALAVFLVALKFAASAAMHFADGPMATMLDWLEVVTALSAMLIVLGTAISKHRHLGPDGWREHFRGDGYLASVLRDASFASLLATWLALLVLEIVSKNTLAHLPPRFFLQLVMVVLLSTLSVKFYLLNRDPV